MLINPHYRRNRVAHWVFEHLTPESTKRAENVDRTKSEFVEDISIHPFFRSSNKDYKYSGFDRYKKQVSVSLKKTHFLGITFLSIILSFVLGATWQQLETT